MKQLPLIYLSFLIVIYSCNTKTTENSIEESLVVVPTETIIEKMDKQFPEAHQLFKTNCTICHGEKMQAFVDRKWKDGKSKEYIIKAIKIGNESGMPGFDSIFSDSQFDKLSEYILTGIENVSKYDFTDADISSDTFQTENFSFILEKAVENLEIPWGMAFLPNGNMLITDRVGILYRQTNDGNLIKISDTPQVLALNQGGLLDVELHPNFIDNQLIYLSYSAFKEEGKDTVSTTAIMRAKLEGNSLTDNKIIFEALPYSKKRHHYGSRIEFDKDGYLFFSVGDRGARDENPQNLESHNGKIHRINADGSIPKDNPFVSTEGAMPSIYSYGHRNPQGLAMHPTTGVIWEHEHGPRGGDEVNIIEKSLNYGWPIISYGINYDGTIFTSLLEKEGMKKPVIFWVPSIAPSGMTFINSDKYPGWEGNILAGSLRYKYLNLCKVIGNQITDQTMLAKGIGRVRNVEMSPDGYIYFSVENPGIIYKIVPLSEDRSQLASN